MCENCDEPGGTAGCSIYRHTDSADSRRRADRRRVGTCHRRDTFRSGSRSSCRRGHNRDCTLRVPLHRAVLRPSSPWTPDFGRAWWVRLKNNQSCSDQSPPKAELLINGQTSSGSLPPTESAETQSSAEPHQAVRSASQAPNDVRHYRYRKLNRSNVQNPSILCRC